MVIKQPLIRRRSRTITIIGIAASIITSILLSYYFIILLNHYPSSISTTTTTTISSNRELDNFGIRKLYPSKVGGEEWYINMKNILSDSRAKFCCGTPGVAKNSDGSWKITNTKVRYAAYPSTGIDRSNIDTQDHSIWAARGYIQAPNDWKNVEMTGYVKVNAYNRNDNFAWYSRGADHRNSMPCLGSSMKGDLYYEGQTRYAKEQWHVSYGKIPKEQSTDPLKGTWIGFKYILYNFEQNGKTVLKMESWLDKNNNGIWIKVNENIDSGGWMSDSGDTKCGGTPDQIITWGGPEATFRWDDATDVDIKYLSVREIQPPLR